VSKRALAAFLEIQAALLPTRLGVTTGSRLAFIRAPSVHGYRLLHEYSSTLQQSDRCQYLELQQSGFAPVLSLEGTYDCVLVCATRQRNETLAYLAKGLDHCKPGGYLFLLCENTLGAKTYRTRLKELLGNGDSEPKDKCLICWGQVDERRNGTLATTWLEALSIQARVPLAANSPEGTQQLLYSSAGCFSAEKLDLGSQLLLEVLPPLSGKGADFGCGYGYLSHQLLHRTAHDLTAHAIEHITLIDSEQLALDAARRNLATIAAERYALLWLDLTREQAPGPFDFIVCNPPCHNEHGLDYPRGQAVIAQAAAQLRPGGVLVFVANEHIPYERELRAHFATREAKIELLAKRDGFKVICLRT
jgi:16S rRNA (guanine1207-N2)-methyltransferase